MNLHRFRSLLLPLLLALCVLPARGQRNGMYYDHRNTYFIPLLSRDELAGQVYVVKADKIGDGTNLFTIGIYNHLMTRVGERDIQLPSAYSFDCAAFDGKDIYTRFVDENRAVRYIVLDRQAAVVFDTTLDLRCRSAQMDQTAYFQQVSMLPIHERGIVDVLQPSGQGQRSATVRLMPGGSVWVNSGIGQANTGSKLLLADERVVVEAAYRFTGGKMSPGVQQTSIVLIDGQSGAKLGESILSSSTEQAFYPVNAAIVNDEIEVLSEFTLQAKSFARVKYGASIHRFRLRDASQTRQPAMNEFTKTLLTEPGLKGRQLLTNSYLYLGHAARNASGNWLLAMQQFSKLPLKVGPLLNRSVRYEVRSLCFLELSPEARVLSSHQENNYGNTISVPSGFFYNPQHSGAYATAKKLSATGYFVGGDTTNRQLAFVYADAGKDTKLRIGSVEVRDGRFEVGKLTRASGSGTMAGILPARIGQTQIVSADPKGGTFSVENIKISN